MKKIKVALFGLLASFVICQVTHFDVLVDDVNLLSCQLIASAQAEGSGSSSGDLECYANVSDTFFNAKPYVRCNVLVRCSDCYGKNPQDKSTCRK